MNRIICGPPGAGKSTYVRTHKEHGDLIVDLDELYRAVSGLAGWQKPEQLVDYVLSVHKFMIDRINPEPSMNKYPNAWVIISGARKEDREFMQKKLNADVIVLDVPASECLRRSEQDDDRIGHGIPWGKLIRQWWDEYERG